MFWDMYQNIAKNKHKSFQRLNILTEILTLPNLLKNNHQNLLPQKSIFQLDKDQQKCPRTQNYAIKIKEKKVMQVSVSEESFRSDQKYNIIMFSVLR